LRPITRRHHRTKAARDEGFTAELWKIWMQREVIKLLPHIIVSAVVPRLQAPRHGLHLGQTEPVRKQRVIQTALGPIEDGPNVGVTLRNRKVVQEGGGITWVQVASTLQLLDLSSKLIAHKLVSQPRLRCESRRRRPNPLRRES
jgi:hypothetical protein